MSNSIDDFLLRVCRYWTVMRASSGADPFARSPARETVPYVLTALWRCRGRIANGGFSPVDYFPDDLAMRIASGPLGVIADDLGIGRPFKIFYPGNQFARRIRSFARSSAYRQWRDGTLPELSRVAALIEMFAQDGIVVGTRIPFEGTLVLGSIRDGVTIMGFRDLSADQAQEYGRAGVHVDFSSLMPTPKPRSHLGSDDDVSKLEGAKRAFQELSGPYAGASRSVSRVIAALVFVGQTRTTFRQINDVLAALAHGSNPLPEYQLADATVGDTLVFLRSAGWLSDRTNESHIYPAEHLTVKTTGLWRPDGSTVTLQRLVEACLAAARNYPKPTIGAVRATRAFEDRGDYRAALELWRCVEQSTDSYPFRSPFLTRGLELIENLDDSDLGIKYVGSYHSIRPSDHYYFEELLYAVTELAIPQDGRPQEMYPRGDWCGYVCSYLAERDQAPLAATLWRWFTVDCGDDKPHPGFIDDVYLGLLSHADREAAAAEFREEALRFYADWDEEEMDGLFEEEPGTDETIFDREARALLEGEAKPERERPAGAVQPDEDPDAPF